MSRVSKTPVEVAHCPVVASAMLQSEQRMIFAGLKEQWLAIRIVFLDACSDSCSRVARWASKSWYLGRNRPLKNVPEDPTRRRWRFEFNSGKKGGEEKHDLVGIL